MRLLAVWERGLKKGPPERALALLASACPESSPEALAGLSVGRRDAALLKLRESVFGQEMTGSVVCGRCGQLLELPLESSRLRQPSSDATASSEVSSATHGYELRMRLPNSNDLLACTGCDLAEIPKQLFARCLIAAVSEGKEVFAEQLPDEVVQAAAEEMAKADPLANLELDISCAACGHQWRELFDIVSFFWMEIDVWARRTLREIHALASVYGWSETEILGLTELRRQYYLERAGAWATS
jgi:hypothetical protein